MSEQTQQTPAAQTPTAPASPPTNSDSTQATASQAASVSDGKPTEPKPQAASKTVPDKYDLKLPEGSLLDAAHMDKLSAYAKQRGLSNEDAQALLERESEAVGAHINALKPGGERWKAQEAEWRAQALADTEIGGSEQKLKESAEFGKRAVEAFFPKEVMDYLNETGFGSHPAVVRGFAKIGRAMANDSLVTGQGGTMPQSIAEKFYGSTK